MYAASNIPRKQIVLYGADLHKDKGIPQRLSIVDFKISDNTRVVFLSCDDLVPFSGGSILLKYFGVLLKQNVRIVYLNLCGYTWCTLSQMKKREYLEYIIEYW